VRYFTVFVGGPTDGRAPRLIQIPPRSRAVPTHSSVLRAHGDVRSELLGIANEVVD